MPVSESFLTLAKNEYFTETGECPEDPIALNDAFEAEYDTTPHEKTWVDFFPVSSFIVNLKELAKMVLAELKKSG